MGLFSKSSRPDPRNRVEPVLNQTDYVDVSSSDSVRMGQIFGDHRTDSGAVVNEKTAMRVSAVYAAVQLIAGAVSTTPCSLYRSSDGGRQKAGDHPYWRLLNQQPAQRFSAATFWEFATAQMLIRGDGIAYIVRAGNRSPLATAFIPVPRDKVEIFRIGDRLAYRITDQGPDGKEGHFIAQQDDVLHFPGMGFDGTSSMSVIGWAARQAIGIAISADQHAAATFGSGASVQYAVTSPLTMSPAQQDAFRDAWVAKYGGGSGHSKIPLILTEGLGVQELSMTSADAQLLESRRFQVVDIARAFGIPPHMIGETSASTSWGTGIEQMSLGFVRYTLRPHLHRFAQELNRKLFPAGSETFIEFNVDGHLEGDSKAQAEFFSKALGGPGAAGWMVVDEVRALKNLPPIEGGDKLAQFATAPQPDNGTPDATDDEPSN